MPLVGVSAGRLGRAALAQVVSTLRARKFQAWQCFYLHVILNRYGCELGRPARGGRSRALKIFPLHTPGVQQLCSEKNAAFSGGRIQRQAPRCRPPLGFGLHSHRTIPSFQYGQGAPKAPEQQILSVGLAPKPLSSKETGMLKWALIFLVVALVAGLFGFTGISAAAAGIAKILFFAFVVLFIIALIAGLVSRGRAPRV
eukprot:TRINITY_DN3650_c0_g2_i1.p1 TRINITY_DN3650_c0_g2~~TRINITY_DN3650_c0_g2_i1.p1  ORF type:complete len:199 (-),score=9.31 TRINITY_DN3650_c0_g2_i1:3-599(-)